MKKIFKSKIGLEFIIPLIIAFGAVLFLTTKGEMIWLGIAILAPVLLFVVHIFMNTNYTVDGNSLKIKCGFLFNKSIDIQQIKKISETNNPLGSPAVSLDRLEIVYGKFDNVIISPKHKNEFIETIVLLNPDIEVKLKKK